MFSNIIIQGNIIHSIEMGIPILQQADGELLRTHAVMVHSYFLYTAVTNRSVSTRYIELLT
jgi:hypothetical protein